MKNYLTSNGIRRIVKEFSTKQIFATDTVSYASKTPMRFPLSEIGFYRDLGIIKVTDAIEDPIDKLCH